MKFGQDMMVYNPFPNLNSIKKCHETANDKQEPESAFVWSEMYLQSKKEACFLKCLALYLFSLSQCKFYQWF